MSEDSFPVYVAWEFRLNDHSCPSCLQNLGNLLQLENEYSSVSLIINVSILFVSHEVRIVSTVSMTLH